MTNPPRSLAGLTLANTSLLVVAVIAAGVSATHIYRLGILLHQPWQACAAQPVAVDGLIVACSSALYRAARADGRGHGLARTGLWSGIAATLAANFGFGVAQNIGRPWLVIAGGAIYSGLPAYAFLICAEVAILSARRTARVAHKTAKTVAPVAPVAPPAGAPRTAPPASAPRVVNRPASDAPTTLKRGSEPAGYDDAVAHVRAQVAAGNPAPSARWLAAEFVDGNRHSASRARAAALNGHAPTYTGSG